MSFAHISVTEAMIVVCIGGRGYAKQGMKRASIASLLFWRYAASKGLQPRQSSNVKGDIW